MHTLLWLSLRVHTRSVVARTAVASGSLGIPSSRRFGECAWRGRCRRSTVLTISRRGLIQVARSGCTKARCGSIHAISRSFRSRLVGCAASVVWCASVWIPCALKSVSFKFQEYGARMFDLLLHMQCCLRRMSGLHKTFDLRMRLHRRKMCCLHFLSAMPVRC